MVLDIASSLKEAINLNLGYLAILRGELATAYAD
jgi:hypothetical protein